MNTRFTLATVLISTAAMVGCASPDLAPTPARNEPYPSQQIVFSGQDDLSSRMVISDIKRSFDNNGLMHLTIPARNTTPIDLYVDYRVIYFDENHVPVDVPSAWQTITLHSNVFEYIQANSSTTRAKDFQIDFRMAQ